MSRSGGAARGAEESDADGAGSRRNRGSSEQRYVVARVDELPNGSRKIVQAGNRSVGVFSIDGRYYALRNACPHQGAPLCIGPVTGTNFATKPYELSYERDGEIVRCPWHGWEFDIITGRSVFNPHKTRVKAYEVSVGEPGEDDVYLETYEVTVEGDYVILHA